MRDIELLAKQMRDKALEQTESTFERQERARRERERAAKLEQLKKVYFNAGRWAGGARDRTARHAFEMMNQVENGSRGI